MASLPSPASWRRPSAEQSSSSATPSSSATAQEYFSRGGPPAESPSAINSQPIHLNDPQPRPGDTTKMAPGSEYSPLDLATTNTTNTNTTQGTTTASSTSSPEFDPEPKICWICQADSNEDTEFSTRWRKPCPCSLDAHDSCLLQWIAAEESPAKGDLAMAKKLACPQCGTPIEVRRPWDPIVALTDTITRTAQQMILPTGLVGLMTCTYAGLWIYGYVAVNDVFGLEETAKLLGYEIDMVVYRAMPAWQRYLVGVNPLYALRWARGPIDGMAPMAVYLALPLVAPTLILQRLKIMDNFFAIGLPIYFLLHPNAITYPPTPLLSLALLPYLKNTYTNLYDRLFATHVKNWELAVQRKPREGETAEDIAAEAQEEAHDAIIGLEIGFEQEEVDVMDLGEDGGVAVPAPDMLDGGENQNEFADLPALIPNPPIPNNNNNGNGAVPLGPINNRPGRNGRNGNNRNWGIEETISTSRLASTLLSALFLPTISSHIGHLLLYTLPRSWTTSGLLTTIYYPSQISIIERAISGLGLGLGKSQLGGWGLGSLGVRKVGSGGGLLTQQWGRSLIGGCLFVVVRDAVMLYVKWRKARDFGRREVLDYVHPKSSGVKNETGEERVG